MNHRGNYIKDLSLLNRPLPSIIIIDNAPTSYLWHPQNAIPITSWFSEQKDVELLEMIQFLKDLSGVVDVRSVLDADREDDEEEEHL